MSIRNWVLVHESRYGYQNQSDHQEQQGADMAKIVIVDDEPDLRALIRMSLEINNHEFFEACDAQTGLQLIESVDPDLILLDVMMPGEINGFILCDILKSSSKFENTPIIFITGADSDEDRITGKLSGANNYLIKPFQPQELVDLSEALLKKKKPAF